jgi:ATP phosphoribosyltransferase regulatory subunit HisZ
MNRIITKKAERVKKLRDEALVNINTWNCLLIKTKVFQYILKAADPPKRMKN